MSTSTMGRRPKLGVKGEEDDRVAIKRGHYRAKQNRSRPPAERRRVIDAWAFLESQYDRERIEREGKNPDDMTDFEETVRRGIQKGLARAS